GALCLDRGDWLAADGYFADSLALAELMEWPSGQAYALNNQGYLAAYRGDLALAAREFAASLSLCEEAKAADPLLNCRFGLALTRCLAGDGAGALAALEPCAPLLAQPGLATRRTQAHALHAEA